MVCLWQQPPLARLVGARPSVSAWRARLGTPGVVSPRGTWLVTCCRWTAAVAAAAAKAANRAAGPCGGVEGSSFMEEDGTGGMCAARCYYSSSLRRRTYRRSRRCWPAPPARPHNAPAALLPCASVCAHNRTAGPCGPCEGCAGRGWAAEGEATEAARQQGWMWWGVVCEVARFTRTKNGVCHASIRLMGREGRDK